MAPAMQHDFAHRSINHNMQLLPLQWLLLQQPYLEPPNVRLRDGGEELVCRLNLWRKGHFKYMKGDAKRCSGLQPKVF
jgi:hypothetical protein